MLRTGAINILAVQAVFSTAAGTQTQRPLSAAKTSRLPKQSGYY